MAVNKGQGLKLLEHQNLELLVDCTPRSNIAPPTYAVDARRTTTDGKNMQGIVSRAAHPQVRTCQRASLHWFKLRTFVRDMKSKTLRAAQLFRRRV